MTKRKKVTRAYKVGFTDGRNDVYQNTYPEGSVWYADYERGFTDGNKLKQIARWRGFSNNPKLIYHNQHVIEMLDMLEQQQAQIDELTQLLHTVYPLVRNQLWIAYVWNDHNFPNMPEHYAREAAHTSKVTNFDEANELIGKIEQLKNGSKNDE